MNLEDLEKLRPGNPGCPSDLTLHRLHAGELQGERGEQARHHVQGCAACQARMAQREAGFGAFPEADPVRMLAAIRRGTEAHEQARPSLLERLLNVAWIPLALGALALVVLVSRPAPRPPDAIDPGTTRFKGIGLHVFHQVHGVAAEAVSGDTFAPGEPIQLQVDLPAERKVAVVGVEASGTLYPVWPRTGGAEKLPAGAHQQIPGAVSLDDTPGDETFHVVACPLEVADPGCRSQGPASAPACAAGCTLTSFKLHRGR